ncbi:MAG: hypothetical protein LBR53_04570 [Deltaproteobacteria bacterium]|nr:hypothetical protein [Deltaproteobacteria bacterium]
MNGLLKSFQKWWAENADGYDKKKDCTERAMQRLIYAYISRVANGGAKIILEHPTGSGFVDLAVDYKDNLYMIEV